MRTFWFDRGRRVEGREYRTQLLARAGQTVSPESRAEALCGLGILLWGQQSGASFVASRELLAEALAIRRQTDDKAALARALSFLARPVWDMGDMVTARHLLRELLELAESVGDRHPGCARLGAAMIS